jgi:formylglycine-generating enzyme required for sulfatase activity
MGKFALLIGVGSYRSPDLNDLLAAPRDVEAMQQVLVDPAIGGFAVDDVCVLQNPEPQEMREEIERLFINRKRSDLVLLYFSGHGVVDDAGQFYLTTVATDKGRLRSTAIESTYVHGLMEQRGKDRSQHQVVILDSCFSGAFAEGMAAKGNEVNLQPQLGGKGRAVLTSSSGTEYSFEQKDGELSVYTQYVVEGLRTGIADKDEDGWISVDELHEFAAMKVREVAPSMQPKIYAVEEGYKIFVAKALARNPKLLFRKEVDKWAKQRDEVILSVLRRGFIQRFQGQIPIDEMNLILDEVLQPYQESQTNSQEPEETFEELLILPSPHQELDDLTYLQHSLGLRDENAGIALDALDREFPLVAEPRQAPSSNPAPKPIPIPQPKPRQQPSQDSKINPASQSKPAEKPIARSRPRSAATPNSKDRRYVLRWLTYGGMGAATIWIVPSLGEWIKLLVKPTNSTSIESIPSPSESPVQADRAVIESNAPTLTSEPSKTPDSENTKILPSKNPPSIRQVEFSTVKINTAGNISGYVMRKTKVYSENLGNGMLLEMALIPGGKFLMGSPSKEKESNYGDSEKPQHWVTVPRFWIGRFEVTQSQWRQVASMQKISIDLADNPSHFEGQDSPVERISWDEAIEFCERLNRETSRAYRLPSEAEWEYACRAGKNTPFSFGENISPAIANYNANIPYGDRGRYLFAAGPSRGRYSTSTTNVGGFPANDFGLYDMHGNVSEWCQDSWLPAYDDRSPTDGSARLHRNVNQWQNYHSVRGGSWASSAGQCRSAVRYGETAIYSSDTVGFRVACSLSP